jgi:hypothetical protein
MMKTSIKLCAGVACLLFASLKVEAAASCSGTVSSVLIYHDSSVSIASSWRGDWTYVCNA